MTTLRLLDGTAVSEPMPSMTPENAAADESSQNTIRLLTILSLVFASISVVSTLPTLYWFVRMRRSFRHELILLLIQSDILKSTAYVIFPIVSLVRGNVESDSTFCQLSGFTLAIGIESADVAILLIALHSVMYIFRPRSGLYPYRRVAYLVFYLFPATTASLAFIRGYGYENVGQYCYLRTDRTWTRLMLSWIPRYFICISIVLIYAFIYLYIWKRIGDYGRRSSEAVQQCRWPSASGSVPATPRICYHGLIPSTPSSRRTSVVDTVSASKDRRRPASSISTIQTGNGSAQAEIQWNWTGFTQAQSLGRSTPEADETGDPLTPDLPPISSPPPAHSPQPRAAPITDCPPARASRDSIHHPPLASSTKRPSHSAGPNDSAGHKKRIHSLTPLLSRLHKIRTRTASSSSSIAEPHHAAPPSPPAPLSSVADDCSSPTAGVVSQQRDRVRRQLRSLFVYPLAYMVVWLFPFVSHILGYDDNNNNPDRAAGGGGGEEDPRWLLVVGIISLCVQGAVDCALFMLREKPWRHAAEGRGFLGSLWSIVRSRGGGIAGRTREEMLVDGRLARERREEEILVERAAREGSVGRPKAVREWWEMDGDGGSDDDDDDDDQGTTRERAHGEGRQEMV
ncbi:G protein-coupled receptor gpr1 [Madurella fahalii]|uniref:G protein-coupled receptor gpr1 n=1 Tax=Madurella fahalii TaxID=1157608 RepID=A0ABQ0GNR7_9PEZI